MWDPSLTIRLIYYFYVEANENKNVFKKFTAPVIYKLMI